MSRDEINAQIIDVIKITNREGGDRNVNIYLKNGKHIFGSKSVSGEIDSVLQLSADTRKNCMTVSYADGIALPNSHIIRTPMHELRCCGLISMSRLKTSSRSKLVITKKKQNDRNVCQHIAVKGAGKLINLAPSILPQMIRIVKWKEANMESNGYILTCKQLERLGACEIAACGVLGDRFTFGETDERSCIQ